MTPDLASENAYEILGVPRNATAPAIKQAYRKLALKHHPDAVPPDQKAEAGQLFARILQAYELLKDAEKRKGYDSLLARGIVPPLSGDTSGIGSLANAVGVADEIEALRIDQDIDLSGMDARLRDEMLLSAMIRSDYIEEKPLELIKLGSSGKWKNYELPPGSMTEGWLVITQLRVMILLKFVHEYQSGNTKYTNTYWRSRAFPFLSCTNMVVHESGRAFVNYQLELKDEDGTEVVVPMPKPRFSRLFLVANVYKIPLKTLSTGSQGGEFAGAIFGTAFVGGLLWGLPFLGLFLYNLGNCACSKEHNCEPFSGFPALFTGMLSYGVTSLAIYGAVLAIMIMCVYVYGAWNLGMAAHLFGTLPRDYALETGEIPLLESAPQPAYQEDQGYTEVPQDVPPPPPAYVPDPYAQTPSGPAAEVEMPEAVRDMLGLPPVSAPAPPPGPSAPQPPAPPPAPPGKTRVFCPNCGAGYLVPTGVKGKTVCKQPNCQQTFQIAT